MNPNLMADVAVYVNGRMARGSQQWPGVAETAVRSSLQWSPAMQRFRNVTDRNGLALVWLRVAVGGLFLIFGEYKVFGTQFTLHGGFQWWIHRFLQDGTAYPFFVLVLEKIVLPHGTVIAFMVAYGELAIGLALVLGICVKTASAFGTVYMIALLFASNFPGSHAPLWQYFGASLDHSVLAACFVAFMIGRSEERFSLNKLRNRFRAG